MREMRGQFTKVFRTRAGLKFYGELSPPLERNPADDFRPRRSLTVSQDALVTTGDVVSSDGSTYLVSLMANLTNTRQFKCFEITHRVIWSRKADQVDPLTGLAKDSTQVIVDSALPIIVERGQIVENMNLEANRYRVLTGDDVKVGDRLGAWIVQSITDANGLKMLEVS